MKVQSPDGQVWRVSRRWVPWRQRIRDVDPLSGFGTDVPVDDLVAGIVLFLVLLVLVPIMLIAAVAGVEFLLLLLVLPFAVLGRMLFGRQWRVEVRRGWRPYCEELAGDWQQSGLRIHELADDIRRGDVPLQIPGLGDYFP
jgi:hypothetical protein